MTKKTTRTDEIAAMMKRKTGATVDQICAKTGMQPHSARAFISRMEATIKKEKTTVYRIEEAA